MKKIFYSSLMLLCLLVLSTPAEAKGKPIKEFKNRERSTIVAPNTTTSTSSNTQTNIGTVTSVGTASQVTTTTSGIYTSVSGGSADCNRSNRGGMRRGLERARYVHELNKLCRNSNLNTIQSGQAVQTQVNTTTGN